MKSLLFTTIIALGLLSPAIAKDKLETTVYSDNALSGTHADRIKVDYITIDKDVITFWFTEDNKRVTYTIEELKKLNGVIFITPDSGMKEERIF